MTLPIGWVGFDLGNTLVRYFTSEEFGGLLAEAVGRAGRLLAARSFAVPDAVELGRRIAAENYEAEDNRVRPVEERLGRIFGVQELYLLSLMAIEFVVPLLDGGQAYTDALPVLRRLRERGVRTALVSNTPWGTPAGPWRQDLARHGLDRYLDVTVFCRDIGWRKPSSRIFQHLLRVTGAAAGEVLFVGDHPVWDVEGARACGLRAVLLDRGGQTGIAGLEEVFALLA